MDIDPILLKRLNPFVAGVIIAALIPFMRKLSDINIWLYKKCGWKGQAEFSDEKRNRWVSFNQSRARAAIATLMMLKGHAAS